MQNGPRDNCYLDKIRLSAGIEKCKAVFLEIYKKDRSRAVTLLNDSRLTFPCLYILLPEIEALQLESSLDIRNITVLKIIRHMQQKSKNDKDHLKGDKETVYKTLKWVLKTGYDDSFDNEYEIIMDAAVSLLINLYKDESILPEAAEMIFNRNRKGHYIHDLVWAFFRSHAPDALKLIAQRICSSDQKDIDLACHLLNFRTSDSSKNIDDKQGLYRNYINWLDENDPFLYFTGESFQFSSNPILCRIDLDRKYMNKRSNSYARETVVPEDENEIKRLDAFRILSEEEKTILSEYSFKIHEKDLDAWKKWIDTSLAEQIKTAKTGGEGEA